MTPLLAITVLSLAFAAIWAINTFHDVPEMPDKWCKDCGKFLSDDFFNLDPDTCDLCAGTNPNEL